MISPMETEETEYIYIYIYICRYMSPLIILDSRFTHGFRCGKLCKLCGLCGIINLPDRRKTSLRKSSAAQKHVMFCACVKTCLSLSMQPPSTGPPSSPSSTPTPLNSVWFNRKKKCSISLVMEKMYFTWPNNHKGLGWTQSLLMGKQKNKDNVCPETEFTTKAWIPGSSYVVLDILRDTTQQLLWKLSAYKGRIQIKRRGDETKVCVSW